MLSTKLQSELLVGPLDVVRSMAYVSAIREIADAEKLSDFSFDDKGYDAIACNLAKLADDIGGDFGAAYREIAQRVRMHAHSLAEGRCGAE